MKNGVFGFIVALFMSACSTPAPMGNNHDGATPVDASDDVNVMPPPDGTVVTDGGTDVVTLPMDVASDAGTDVVTPPTDTMVYPVCPASASDGMCQLPDGRMSNVNLPPGQAYDPWLRDSMGTPTNRNMVPASGTERMRMAATGEYPDWFVPCWENLFNDDWGFTYLTGSRTGSSTSTTVMARLTGGMYSFNSSVGAPGGEFVWSVRNGQGSFWSGFGRVGVPDAYYCQALMTSSCSEMSISCWRSPTNPLTTPSAPPETTILGQWVGDHTGP